MMSLDSTNLGFYDVQYLSGVFTLHDWGNRQCQVVVYSMQMMEDNNNKKKITTWYGESFLFVFHTCIEFKNLSNVFI